MCSWRGQYHGLGAITLHSFRPRQKEKPFLKLSHGPDFDWLDSQEESSSKSKIRLAFASARWRHLRALPTLCGAMSRPTPAARSLTLHRKVKYCLLSKEKDQEHKFLNTTSLLCNHTTMSMATVFARRFAAGQVR